MHTYLIASYNFFSGYEQCTIKAKSKADAIEKCKLFAPSNYGRNDVCCIEKLHNGGKSKWKLINLLFKKHSI